MSRTGVAASGAVGLVGSILGALLGFALIAVVGRGLGVAETGLFFQVVGWFLIASALLRLGADTGLLRTWAVQVDHAGRDMYQALWVAVVPVAVISLAAAVGLQWAAPPLAVRLDTLDPAATEQMIRILAVCLPAAVLVAVLLAGLRGLGSVVAFSVLQNIAIPGLRVALAGVVVWFGLGGIATVLVAWIVPLPLILAVVAVLVSRRLPSRDAVGAASPQASVAGASRRFWSFSAARGVAGFLETLLDWIDVLIVAALTTPTHAGVYAVVTRLVRAGLVVDTAVRIAVAPRIATLLHQGDRAGTSVLFSALARVVILLAWPAYLVLMVFGPTVLGWFGSGFDNGARVLVVLSVAMMLALAAGMVQSLLLMGGRSHYQMTNKAVAVVVNVAVNLWLVPIYGIEGAAVAWVVTLVVDTLLAALQVRFRMGVALRLLPLVLPASLALGVVGGGALAFRWVLGQSSFALGVALALGGCVYVAILWLLRERLGLVELMRL